MALVHKFEIFSPIGKIENENDDEHDLTHWHWKLLVRRRILLTTDNRQLTGTGNSLSQEIRHERLLFQEFSDGGVDLVTAEIV
jgi:hypothetical protein